MPRFIDGVQDLSWTKFAYPRNSLYSIRLSTSSVVLRVMRFVGHKLIWKHSN